jgi:hypothetical protein
MNCLEFEYERRAASFYRNIRPYDASWRLMGNRVFTTRPFDLTQDGFLVIQLALAGNVPALAASLATLPFEKQRDFCSRLNARTEPGVKCFVLAVPRTVPIPKVEEQKGPLDN